MPTLTPQRGDEDQRLNPGNRHSEALNDLKHREKSAVDDEFGKILNANGYDQDPGAAKYKEPSKDELSSREKNPNSNFTYSNDDKAQAKGGIGGALKSRRGKILLGAGITGGVGIAGIIFALIASFLMHIGANFTEFSTKRGYVKSTQRHLRIAEQKHFDVPDDNCTGIRCRLTGGVSDKEISRLEKNGLIKNDATHVGTTPGGKKYILQYTLSDGTAVTKSNYPAMRKSNPELLLRASKATEAKSSYHRSTFSVKQLFRAGFNRTNPLKDKVSEKDMREEARKRIAGVETNGERFRVNGTDENPDGTRNANAAVDGLSSEITEAADAQREAYLKDPYSRVLTPSIDVTDTARSAARGALNSLRVTGGFDNICHGYSLLKMADFGAKYYRMIGLVRYAGIFLTFADAMKTGDIKAEQVAFLAGLLMKPDAQGRSFADSAGAQYIFYGRNPTKNSVSKYTLGTAMSQGLTEARNMINNITGGNADAACKVTRNVGYQIGSAVLSLGLAIITGGGSIAASAAAGVATGVIVATIEAYAIPALISYAAGTPMTLDESGYEAGTAMAAGTGALGALMGRSQGKRPLTRAQVAQDDRETAQLLAAYGFESTPPAHEKLTMNLAMFGMSTIGSIQSMTLTPGKLLGFAARGDTSSTAFATEPAVPLVESDDPDINALGLATDATGNLLYSESSALIESEEYKPSKVMEYMIGNGHIDEETGEPKSDDYKEYAGVCMDSLSPILSTDNGGEGEYGDVVSGDLCLRTDQKHNMFALQRGDLVETEPEEEVTKMIEEGIDAPGSGAAPGGTAGNLPAGSTQELAQKILDHPNIQFQVEPTQRNYMQTIANTGKASQCGAPEISAKILGVILGLADKYKITVGVLVDGHKCDGGYHPRGMGADLNGITNLDGSSPTSNGGRRITASDYSSNNAALRAAYIDAAKLIAAAGGGHMAQRPCFGNPPSDAELSGVKMYGTDGCNHLHLEVN